MTSDGGDWDDDRLASAFAARAASTSARIDLARDVLDRLRSPSARRSAWSPLRLATAAAVLVAVGLGALATRTLAPPPAVGAIPSAALSELDDLGLSLMSASQAALVRDRDRDDREVAVHGLFRLGREVPGLSCPPMLRMPVNPALPQACGETDQRIVDVPATGGADVDGPLGSSPSQRGGNSIRPLFPMLDQSVLMNGLREAGASGIEVVAIGHFDDRRSVLCGTDEQECRDTFLVDRILAVGGAWVEPSTGLSLGRLEPGRVLPKWTAADVDPIVAELAPAVRIVSRLAIPGERIFEIEPALGTGSLGIIDRQLVWVVNGLEPQPNQPPRVRTFILVDGDPTEAYASVAYSVSRTGFAPINLPPTPRTPAATEPPVTPSPNPTLSATADFPTSWLGLPVVGVSDVIARQTPDSIDDTAILVRGWYVAPDPTNECPTLQDDRGPIEQPCPGGQHWLLEQPERLWTDPGAPWIDRRPTGPALNPIVLPDVPFDVPNLWFDTGPSPLPVVLLGHLRDARPGYDLGVAQFVVDALVWRAGQAATADPWLMEPSAEDVTSVKARVDRAAGPALATWLSVVSGAELAVLHPDAAAELRGAPAVWIARSLVVEDGRPRVQTLLTADEGRRVWSGMTLLTTIDLQVGDGVTLEISDGPNEIVAARAGLPGGAAEWVTGDGPPETGEVMLGVVPERPKELRIAWIGGDCDRTWRLAWSGADVFLWPRERLDTCRLNRTRREVVLTFDDPVELEAITVSNGGTGG